MRSRTATSVDPGLLDFFGASHSIHPVRRGRERETRHASAASNVPVEERAECAGPRLGDARSEAYLRIFGVLFGGLGLAIALFRRRSVRPVQPICPLDTR